MPIYYREKLKKFYEERICSFCGGFFYVLRKGVKPRALNSFIRSKQCKTCSRNCSRKYKIERW